MSGATTTATQSYQSIKRYKLSLYVPPQQYAAFQQNQNRTTIWNMKSVRNMWDFDIVLEPQIIFTQAFDPCTSSFVYQSKEKKDPSNSVCLIETHILHIEFIHIKSLYKRIFKMNLIISCFFTAFFLHCFSTFILITTSFEAFTLHQGKLQISLALR